MHKPGTILRTRDLQRALWAQQKEARKLQDRYSVYVRWESFDSRVPNRDRMLNVWADDCNDACKRAERYLKPNEYVLRACPPEERQRAAQSMAWAEAAL